jgi:hypothetical protein
VASISLIGLGCGATLYYAKTGQQWTCYEIDPSVLQLAHHADLFKFVTSCLTPPTIYCADGFSAIDQLSQQDVIIVDTFFGDHNTGAPDILEKLIIAVNATAVFILHVSGLSEADLLKILAIGTSCGFAAIMKEIPSHDNKSRKCYLGDFRHPFHIPSKWLVMSRNPLVIAALAALPEWKLL